MKKREEIENKFKWDLSSYFNSDEEIDCAYNFVKNNMHKISNFENKLNNKTDILNCFKLDEEISYKLGLLSVFSALKTKENALDSKWQQLANKIEKLSVEYSTLCSFITVELTELDDSILLKFANDVDFQNYDLFFKDIIKNKKHMLSKKEEKLLAGTGEFAGQFSDIFDMFDTADIKFPNVLDSNGSELEMNNSIYHKYIQSSDRVLRKNAYKAMNGTYGKLNHLLTSNYMGNVKEDCFYSKIRGFSSALDASLYSEEVPESVYNTLISNVNKNLNVFQEFFEIKRKTLNLQKLGIFDMNVGTIPSSKEYSYFESFDIVKKALACLGEDYVSVLDQAKNERWLDVYANEGKDTGAFSWGFYGKHPVVLLNHENTLNCVFTLAHEMGHSMHTYYSNLSQPIQKAGYEIFVAEVASTVNEMLLVKYFIKNAKSNEEKIYYYDYLMKMFYSTVFRQTLFAEFEQFAHETYEKGGDTTSDALNKYYYNLNKHYFGEKVEFVDEVQYEWSRIPHFYSSFYVYKYATGIISAFLIASKISDGDDEILRGYRKFLTLGSTMPPVELLKIAGVDLTKQETFDYIFENISKILKEWEQSIQ